MSTPYPKQGPILRDKVRLQVLKGFYPTEPRNIQHRAPVTETILSGQFVIRDTDGWKLTTAVDSTDLKNEIYVAQPDSTDHDVQSAGVLVAISTRGTYEIQTGHFDTTQTYTLGDELMVGANGTLVPVTTGKVVVAKISATTTASDAIIDLAGVNSSAKDLRVLQVVLVAPYITAMT